MSQYAIISLQGKQYVVREGERFLVDRLDREEGKTFHPDLLFVGGEKGGELSPKNVTVTAKVIGHELGGKVRIGKYRPKSGYKRHTGFRASLTRIEITGIGGGAKPAPAAKVEAAPKAAPAKRAPAKRAPAKRAPAAKAAPAKRAPAKRAPAKRAPAKRAPAKKTEKD